MEWLSCPYTNPQRDYQFVCFRTIQVYYASMQFLVCFVLCIYFACNVYQKKNSVHAELLDFCYCQFGIPISQLWFKVLQKRNMFAT